MHTRIFTHIDNQNVHGHQQTALTHRQAYRNVLRMIEHNRFIGDRNSQEQVSHRLLRIMHRQENVTRIEVLLNNEDLCRIHIITLA